MRAGEKRRQNTWWEIRSRRRRERVRRGRRTTKSFLTTMVTQRVNWFFFYCCCCCLSPGVCCSRCGDIYVFIWPLTSIRFTCFCCQLICQYRCGQKCWKHFILCWIMWWQSSWYLILDQDRYFKMQWIRSHCFIGNNKSKLNLNKKKKNQFLPVLLSKSNLIWM